jgi:hypothetical protein
MSEKASHAWVMPPGCRQRFLHLACVFAPDLLHLTHLETPDTLKMPHWISAKISPNLGFIKFRDHQAVQDRALPPFFDLPGRIVSLESCNLCRGML